MFTAIINDCQDVNALGRQAVRLASYFDRSPTTIGVDFGDTLQAGGHLVDLLDAASGRPGVILVNVAPRNGAAKNHNNGTPFCYFYYGETLVVASVDGFTLSLLKRFGLPELHLLDIKTLTQFALDSHLITHGELVLLQTTQFRSYELTPRIAAWLMLDNLTLPSTLLLDERIPDAPQAIWFIDNFGNCKTTLFFEELNFGETLSITTPYGRIPYYAQLRNIPDNECGIIIGSSGINEKRFIELVLQGGNAAKTLKINQGDTLQNMTKKIIPETTV